MRRSAKLSQDGTGKIVLEKPELKRQKYRIEIRMKKPEVIVDEYVKEPSRDNILEMFGLNIQQRMLDEKFIIRIQKVKEN